MSKQIEAMKQMTWGDAIKAISALAEQPATVQEPVTLQNNVALKIANDAALYRELVWHLSGKVMALAESAWPIDGQVNRVQVTAEAMNDLKKFVEQGVAEKLAFFDNSFTAHEAEAWKLNTPQPPAQQEPVAYWIPKAEQFCIANPSGRPFAKAWEPLYTSQQPPAQRTWVELTDEERQEIWEGCDPTHAGYVTALVEAKLKEKNA